MNDCIVDKEITRSCRWSVRHICAVMFDISYRRKRFQFGSHQMLKNGPGVSHPTKRFLSLYGLADQIRKYYLN